MVQYEETEEEIVPAWKEVDWGLNDEQQAFIKWTNLIGTFVEDFHSGKIKGVTSVEDFIHFVKDNASRSTKSANKLD